MNSPTTTFPESGMTVDEAMAFLRSGSRSQKKPKPRKETRLFPKNLAIFLNPKRPDLTGAIVLYDLLLWKAHARKLPYPVAGGVSCYRSLSQMEKDNPFLARSTIHAALARLESRLSGQFQVLRNKDHMRFILGEEIDTLCKGAKICLLASDAVALGIPAAILLSHLNHVNAIRPDLADCYEGHAYYRVSPAVLSQKTAGEPILPLSRSTIQFTLTHLVNEKVLLRHPEIACHYARINYPKLEAKASPKFDQNRLETKHALHNLNTSLRN